VSDSSLTVGGGAETHAAGAADFIALLKPRVMSLVVFTAFVGMVLAPGDLHPVLAVAALICIAVGAGAAGAINMWYDADIDRVMARTAARPIPAGRIAPGEALGFGVVLAVGAVLAMGLFVNLAAAALLALTVAFYVFVYTMWLKRRTPQNIVIGGAAGAFPPMIGWAAVNGEVAVGSVLLFAIIFMWTPPHFWALSLYKAGEYARAGVPMLPVVAGERETRRQILIYAVLLAPLAVSPSIIGLASPIYGIVAALLGGLFIAASVAVFRAGDGHYGSARRLFGYSIFYLAAIFAGLLADRLWLGQ
jgi:protoheme IX farnesyltransferase